MNPWLVTAMVLLICMIGPLVACSRGEARGRLVGLEAASTIAIAILLLLSIGLDEDYIADLSLTLAFLTFGGGLVFARFLERWF
jgi:multicomponent Na+:H+ antiporter subunit F